MASTLNQSKDYYLTEEGDIAISNNGDIAITATPQERIIQQSQMRLATQTGDFTPYPKIGASLQRLIGLPNTPSTARFGKQLIERALTYDGLTNKGQLKIDATPTQSDVIMFETKIPYGTREYILITLNQLLS